MAYKKKAQEEKRKEIDLLVKQADEKIDKVFSSPNDLKEYLSFMAKFHNYSYRNSILIETQFRGAIAVGSFAFWKEKGYSVNKGEKGIKILVPTKLGDRFIAEDGNIKLLSKASEKEKQLIKNGDLETLEGTIKFKQGYVFDAIQTNIPSSDLPNIFPNKWLEGDIKNYKAFYKSLEDVADKIGIKIIEPKSELGLVKGVSYTATREVALNPRNSELQNIKTLIHELAHAKLHTVETRDNYTKAEKEFQAEMVALSVSSYFGINTEEYSLRYLSEWTKNANFKDKEKLLKEVSTTVKEYVEIMEDSLNTERELTKENELVNSLSVKNIKNESELNLEMEGEMEFENEKFIEIKDENITNNENEGEKNMRNLEKENEKLIDALVENVEEFNLEFDGEEFNIDDFNSNTIVTSNEMVKKILEYDRYELLNKFESEMTEEDKQFLKDRGFILEPIVDRFLNDIKDFNFDVEFEEFKFSNFLEETISGIKGSEYEDYLDNTIEARHEMSVIGENEYREVYGENNIIDNKEGLYIKLYNDYLQLDLDKTYSLKENVDYRDFNLNAGEKFKVKDYVNGEIKIEVDGKEQSTSWNLLLNETSFSEIVENSRNENRNKLEKLFNIEYTNKSEIEINTNELLNNDLEKMFILKDRINEAKMIGEDQSKDCRIDYGILKTFSERFNEKLEILDKLGIKHEGIEKIDKEEVVKYSEKAKFPEVGEVKIFKSESVNFKENQILLFNEANKLFEVEEANVKDLKTEYEKENKYYPYEKVNGEVKINDNVDFEFRYDIGAGEFNNLADLLERQLSNTNHQYEVKDFLIEQGVRENDKEEKGINEILSNLNYEKENESER